MELLKTFRKKSLWSELAYIFLNILFAVAVLFVVRATESPVLALVLVLMSKWRVLAVRPRYWLTNIQSNLVDFVVSLSTVMFLWVIDGSTTVGFGLQIAITALHIAWLVLIKPLSTKTGAVWQAAVALVFGVSALFMVGYAWPLSIVVLGMWLLGYITARHILTTYDKEDHLLFLCLLWGLILAQIGWVAYHWAIAYSLPFIDTFQIPQVTIIVLALAIITYKIYDSYATNGEVTVKDIALPLLFSVSVVVVLLLFFSGVGMGIF